MHTGAPQGRVAGHFEQQQQELKEARKQTKQASQDLERKVQAYETGLVCVICGSRQGVFTSLAVISALSILILGALVLSGHMPPATAGFAAVGVAPVGFIAGLLALDKLSKHEWTIIAAALMAIAFIVVGAVGGAGILSGAQLGWGLIGTFLIGGILCGISCRIDYKNNNKNLND